MGPFFTWSNGRLGADSVALRLDREICNDIWLNFWRRINCKSLIRHHSDHHPLLLYVDAMDAKNAVLFKFSKTWTSHVDCRRLAVDTWSKNVCGFGMLRLQLKLKILKVVFKHWNRNIFSDVDKQVWLVVDEVQRIQHLIDTVGITDQLYAQNPEAQLLLTKALNFQDQLWKEQARNQHFIHGDQNTSYYHRMAKVRLASKSISFLNVENSVITTPADIEAHILAYFQSIFSVDNNCGSNNMVAQMIPRLVTDNDNIMLSRLPLQDEVKSAVFFYLNGDGAPGQDGFGGHFY